MTRKDYERIAAAVNNAFGNAANDDQREGVSLAMYQLIDALAAEPTRFNEDIFVAACTKPIDPILFREDNP